MPLSESREPSVQPGSPQEAASSHDTVHEQEALLEHQGEAMIERSIDDIGDVEDQVVETLGVTRGTAEAVKLTDEALGHIAEQTLQSPESTTESRRDVVEDVAIETALEMAHGATPDQTAMAVFHFQEYPGTVESVAAELSRTHALLPDGHEAAPLVMEAVDTLSGHPAMQQEHTVEYLTEQPAQKAERMTDDDDKLSEEAYKIVRGLRIQRAQAGQEIADVYKDGLVMQPVYSTYEARMFLEAKDTNPVDDVAILRELEAIAKHEANQQSGLYDKDMRNKVYKDALEKSMLSLFMTVDAKKIPTLLAMKSQDGGFMRRMYGQATDGLRAFQNAYGENKAIQAHLEGFSSVKEKYEAMLGGAIAQDAEFLKSGYLAAMFENESSEIDRDKAAYNAMEYMSEELGLSERLASEIFLSAQSHITPDRKQFEASEHQGVRTEKLISRLERVGEAVQLVGKENIQRLRSECGIVNFADMSDDQLQRMVRFLDNDPELAEQLQDKEVCVILRDATADWNNAFNGVYQQFEPSDGVMLPFEISSMAQSGKQLNEIKTLLADRGVKPSVLVIAGHGAPGLVDFGGDLLLARSPSSESTITGDYATIYDDVGDIIASMQPDRDGNTHVIYKTCSSGGTINQPVEGTELPSDSSSLRGLTSTEEVFAVADELSDRPTPESLLVRTANLARERRPDLTYQVTGIDAPGNLKVAQDGALYDREQATTQIIAPRGAGTVYRRYAKEVAIPMYKKEPKEVDVRGIVL